MDREPLAQAGREVIILEAESAFGTHTSARNSEVIHAGIYYASGSMKARLCVAGRERFYAFCEDHGVPHRPARWKVERVEHLRRGGR